MDKGEWNLADYTFEKAKQSNELVRKQIEIDKLTIRKRELELEISGIDLNISEHTNKMESIKQTIAWCEKKIEEHGRQ